MSKQGWHIYLYIVQLVYILRSHHLLYAKEVQWISLSQKVIYSIFLFKKELLTISCFLHTPEHPSKLPTKREKSSGKILTSLENLKILEDKKQRKKNVGWQGKLGPKQKKKKAKKRYLFFYPVIVPIQKNLTEKFYSTDFFITHDERYNLWLSVTQPSLVSNPGTVQPRLSGHFWATMLTECAR